MASSWLLLTNYKLKFFGNSLNYYYFIIITILIRVYIYNIGILSKDLQFW